MKIRIAALSALAAGVIGASLFAPAFSQGQPAANSATAPAATDGVPLPPLIDAAIIDAALEGMVRDQRLIGVSALVYEHDKEVYFGAFGFADRENHKPMTRDTVVQIFSMTKPVVGVALMQMYERGKFKLDDPLSNYLPEYANVTVYAGEDASGQPKFEPPKRPILVRDILRHTAGFIGGADDSPVGRLYRAADLRGGFANALPEVSQKLASVPLLYQPGTRWLYSDAVDIQAALTQKLSGVPFDQYLKLHIFRPLGMSSVRYTILPTDPDRPQLAAMYTRNDDGTFTRQPDDEAYRFNSADWPYKPGSFGLVATIDDYMKFARMLQGGGKLGRARILRPETVKLMATDAMPGEVTDKSWLPSKGQVGFGIDFAVRVAPPKDASESSGQVGEFFWDGAASTLFWVDPKNGITAVLFTQMRPFDKIKLHKAFRDAVYHNIPEALAK
jgi:CubicO group peptidase (beta-lactamase class C family)